MGGDMKSPYPHQHPHELHPFNRGYALPTFPRDVQFLTLDDFVVEDSPDSRPLRHAKDAAEDFVERFDVYRKTGTGLLFYGPSGVGKTLLASIAAQSGVAQILPSRAPSSMGRFITMADYGDMVRQSMNTPTEDDYEDVYWAKRTLKQMEDDVQILVIDDVGKEYRAASGFIESRLDDLLRTRHHNRRITILTSNLRPDEWAQTYNESMRTFVYEICNVKPMVLRSYPDFDSYRPPTWEEADNYRVKQHMENDGRPQLIPGRLYPVFKK